MSNADRAAQTGCDQTWNAQDYAGQAGYVAELGRPVIDLLKPKAGERILDLGCGDGRLSGALEQSGARVLACDSSPDMAAQTRAIGVEARVLDGQALPFDEEFNAVFSNAALHWMKDGQAVIEGVHRALISGGRFVGEFGGFGNIAAITAAITAVLNAHGLNGAGLNPWFFPTKDAYRALLEGAGFKVERIDLFARPTLLPQGMKNWLDMFGQAFFLPTGDLSDRLKDDVITALQPVLRDGEGRWWADHVRLRFAAFKN